MPDEWNIREAYVAAPDGTRVVDFRDSKLHVVSYSEPVRATLPLETLRERLFTLPDQPDLIPYRTSYYARTWGFCLSHRQLLELRAGRLRGGDRLDARAGPPDVRRAGDRGRDGGRGPGLDLRMPPLARQRQPLRASRSRRCSRRTLGRRLRHTYRFLFAPGTIGPLAWLHSNRDALDRIVHGLTVSCIGDGGDLTYKRSRRGDADVDRAVETVLRDSGKPHRVLEWEPWGGDERQFCAPGFDLPVGTLMRTPHGEFDGYHTSADAMDRISPEALGGRGRDLPRAWSTYSRATAAHQPQPLRRAAARPPRPLPLRRRRGRHARTTSARCCGSST